MCTKKSPNENLFDYQKDLLKNEISIVHSDIATYDDLSFRIKTWAVTIWSAVIAFGVQNKNSLVILASLPVLITFWILDAYIKQYQRRSIFRIGSIEKFLDSDGDYSLKSSFETENFGNFPIHDPVGIRTKKLSPAYTTNYLMKTSYWECFFNVPNVTVFFLLLILSSITISLLVNKF